MGSHKFATINKDIFIYLLEAYNIRFESTCIEIIGQVHKCELGLGCQVGLWNFKGDLAKQKSVEESRETFIGGSLDG